MSAARSSQLWLTLDVGNTHTVGGVFQISERGAEGSAGTGQAELIQKIRYRTDAQATPDEYRLQLSQLLSESWSKIDRCILATVVPSLDRVVREACSPFSVLTIQHLTRREFELDLPFPEQLGADRLANVAGALTHYEPPFLIVDGGTATTFCLVDSKRRYIGGAITPGLEISWRALIGKAARLYSVELTHPESSVGRTTDHQLQSGLLLGYESLVEGMTNRLIENASKEFPDFGTSPRLIATGGCMQLLKLNSRFVIEPDLTLLGLLRYGQLNP